MADLTSDKWLERVKASRARGRLMSGSVLARIALSTSARDLILADVVKWCEYASMPGAPEGAAAVAAYIAAHRAFRSLLYYRLSGCPSRWIRLMLPAFRAIWRPLATLAFHPDSLGPGCFILHGDSTMVIARSIGSNFVVGQHVVLGFEGADGYPTIGDDVSIYVGAIVIGDVTVEDGATVGAGAVVVNDVAARETVVGVPAHPVSPVH